MEPELLERQQVTVPVLVVLLPINFCFPEIGQVPSSESYGAQSRFFQHSNLMLCLNLTAHLDLEALSFEKKLREAINES